MNGIDPDDLFEWVGDPVAGPMPLVMLTEGWIEASEAMGRVHEVITAQADLTPIVEFDVGRLLDQRARRPVVVLNDGIIGPMQWPAITLSVGTDANDQPFLFLHGPEPDFNWSGFATAVSRAASTVGVSTMFVVGAYPVPAPHSREIRISHAASCPELLGNREHTAGSLTVPVGVQMAVTEELVGMGVPTLGIYAQVPYYISTTPWPQASIALLADLADASGLTFDSSALEASVPEAVATVESMLEETPSLAGLVSQLEQRFDDLRRIEEVDVPSGDQIEEELQEYLRSIDDP